MTGKTLFFALILLIGGFHFSFAQETSTPLREILPDNAAQIRLISTFETRTPDLDTPFFYSAMSLSGDGRIIATSYEDISAGRANNLSILQLWNSETLQLLQTFTATGFYNFILSMNGEHLGLLESSSQISLWDSFTGEAIFSSPYGEHIRFSNNNQYFAYVMNDAGRLTSGEENVVLFDLLLKQEIAQIPVESSVLDLRFSPDSSQIAAVTSDGLIRVWALDADSTEPYRVIGNEGDFTFQVFFSADSTVLTYVLLTGEIYSFDIANGVEIHQTSCVEALRFTTSKEAGSVFPTCADGTLRLVNVQNSEISPPLLVETYWDLNVSETILLSSEDDSIELVAIETGEVLKTLAFDEQVMSAKFTPDGQRLIVVTRTGRVLLYGI